MKKVIIFVVGMAFITSVASVAFARTMAEEMSAVRDYLNVVDAKLATAKQAKNKKRVDLLHAEKTATLARWYKLKASMATPVEAPAPAPTVVNVQPPSVTVITPTTPGLFGMQVPIILSGQYINTGAGQYSGTLGLKGDIVMDDFIGLGGLLGMPAKTIKYRVGTGYYQGGGDGLKAIPIYAGGIISLAATGLDAYLTGGLNYVVYGNGQTAGKIGGDVYLGINADLGFGIGKTGFEIGYNVIRSDTASSKGLSLSVAQPIVL